MSDTLPTAWHALWVEPHESSDCPPAQRPAVHVAGEVTIPGAVAAAHLHATAHGVYEAFVNGTRVGDIELSPGFTAYRKRLQVHTFDVTDLLVAGENALGALVSDGWWRGQHGVVRELDAYGSRLGFLAELHVTLHSGEELVFGTDGTWRSRTSHILAADPIAGEVHDHRLRVTRWAEPGTDRSGWSPVTTVEVDPSVLCEPIGPPVRRIEELAARSLTEVSPGRLVVDFGQNSNGWVRLDDLGPEGTAITLTYAEWLDTNGNVSQANIATPGLLPSAVALPFQTDVVTSAGDGASFEPRHTTKGFQYVGIEGHPGPLDPRSIASVVVHSDLRRIGDFSCSDERINALHRAAVWSFRGNACDIPTDCPHRERSGWVGDWQIYVDTAAYLYDVTDFSRKWLLDLAADQRDDGVVTNIVPDPSPDAPIWSGGHGAAGWGDAAVHVPWELYRATGRTDVLSAQYRSMCGWVDYAARRAREGRHASRVEPRPEPLPHERFLWDTGWHFGEWLEPGVDTSTVFATIATADHACVATAYLHRSALELAEIAAVLGDDVVAERYGALAAGARDAWRVEFVNDEGVVRPATQANLVRALAFGLVPDELRARAADDLVTLIREADTHLGTGFLSTPFLLPVLADHGHLDVAYQLLVQDGEPSWLHMLETSTTIWETWDAVKDDGTAAHSLNHYSKGAVISFLHRYVAGLQIVEPGYQRFRVAPRPGGGITNARTHHDSPRGRIELEWELDDQRGRLTVTVPPGTAAELVLPDGTTDLLSPGEHERTWRTP